MIILYIFSVTEIPYDKCNFIANHIIKRCIRLINDPRFDSFILLIIVFSSLGLIIESYGEFAFLDYAELTMNIIFILEMVIKVIALGFIIGDNRYLDD